VASFDPLPEARDCYRCYRLARGTVPAGDCPYNRTEARSVFRDSPRSGTVP